MYVIRRAAKAIQNERCVITEQAQQRNAPDAFDLAARIHSLPAASGRTSGNGFRDHLQNA